MKMPTYTAPGLGHGGKRRGAGKKPTLKNPSTPKVYLDRDTRKFMENLGDGNLSAGIREAHRLLTIKL